MIASCRCTHISFLFHACSCPSFQQHPFLPSCFNSLTYTRSRRRGAAAWTPAPPPAWAAPPSTGSSRRRSRGPPRSRRTSSRRSVLVLVVLNFGCLCLYLVYPYVRSVCRYRILSFLVFVGVCRGWIAALLLIINNNPPTQPDGPKHSPPWCCSPPSSTCPRASDSRSITVKEMTGRQRTYSGAKACWPPGKVP